MDFYGEEDMDFGYDDVAVYDDDGFFELLVLCKCIIVGVLYKCFCVEMECCKLFVLVGL